MTLKINRVLDSHKDQVCTKFGQNPLKDVVSSVHKDVMEGRTEGRTDGSVTTKLGRNIVLTVFSLARFYTYRVQRPPLFE
jgi:hypothetical protein